MVVELGQKFFIFAQNVVSLLLTLLLEELELFGLDPLADGVAVLSELPLEGGLLRNLNDVLVKLAHLVGDEP